ncbi:hypothetical protein BDV10DRAFT_161709 [Aspergillus recurvatus]
MGPVLPAKAHTSAMAVSGQDFAWPSGPWLWQVGILCTFLTLVMSAYIHKYCPDQRPPCFPTKVIVDPVKETTRGATVLTDNRRCQSQVNQIARWGNTTSKPQHTEGTTNLTDLLSHQRMDEQGDTKRTLRLLILGTVVNGQLCNLLASCWGRFLLLIFD